MDLTQRAKVNNNNTNQDFIQDQLKMDFDSLQELAHHFNGNKFTQLLKNMGIK